MAVSDSWDLVPWFDYRNSLQHRNSFPALLEGKNFIECDKNKCSYLHPIGQVHDRIYSGLVCIVIKERSEIFKRKKYSMPPYSP